MVTAYGLGGPFFSENRCMLIGCLRTTLAFTALEGHSVLMLAFTGIMYVYAVYLLVSV